MEARQLKQFIAIAEEGSFSGAADRVGVAQPSLSQMVRLLEQELHVELVVRIPRGVTLTQAGATLVRHARVIIAATEQAIEEVRLTGTEAIGPVTVGFPSSVSMALSVPLAETTRVVLPQVALRVAEAMSGFIREWLEDKSIDLGILYDKHVVRSCETRLLFTEHLNFYSAPDAWPFQELPGTPVRLADVASEELILPSPAHGLRAMIDRYAKGISAKLNVNLEMDALSQIKVLISRGSGYTILAPAAAQDFVDAGKLVSSPIIDPILHRPAYLVRNSSKPQTRAAKEVEALVLKVVADLVRRGLWLADLAPNLAEI